MIPERDCGMLEFAKTRLATALERNHPLGYRYIIREIGPHAKLADEVALAAIETAVPRQTVEAVVAELGVSEGRRRKLPAATALLLAVAMNLFSHDSLAQVLVKLLQGLRLLWPDPDFPTANRSAICQARYRLGARPVVELFHRVCKPMATENTKGAFLYGLRLVAIDATTEDVPDTSENARAFGRHSTDRGSAAFPQVQGVYLIECGTHAIFDAGFWPCHGSEDSRAQRLLRSLKPGMLLLWDTGLHSFAIAERTRRQEAHFLGRVPAGVKFQPLQHLGDGSYLAYIRPADKRRYRSGERMLVRVIEYTLTDPARVGFGETHRLMTSLLADNLYPALELVCAYHERWEVELAIDETDTHQRLAQRPLRSQKPVGVIQELYGLLIAHYAIRHTMHQAALQAGLDPDRLSFSNAVKIICNAVTEFQLVTDEQHPALYRRLLQDIARHRLPQRDNRINPRVVKRKMSKFQLKRPEHQHWPQPTRPFREAVAMLN